MARTIEWWYNQLVSEKQNFNSLNGLTPVYDLTSMTPQNPFKELMNEIASQSKVAIWKLYCYIVAVANYTLDVFWDETKTEMEEIAANSVVANAPWYADQVKKWQYGAPLIWNPNTFKYYYADDSSSAALAKRLVKQVAVVEVNSGSFHGVVIKVKGAIGQLDNTPGTEEDSLFAYLSEIKPAGVQTSIVNLPGDNIRLHLKVYYDGTLILNDFKTVIEGALETFFSTIQFNGIFYTNKLVDALQKVTGTKEPWCFAEGIEAKADSDLVYADVTESYEPVSGHFVMVPVGNTIGVDTVIEYIAI